MLETLKKAKSFMGISKTKEELDLSETSHLRRNAPINSTMPLPPKCSSRYDLSKTQENLRTLSMQLNTSRRLSKEAPKETHDLARLDIANKTMSTRLSTERKICARNNSFSASQYSAVKTKIQSSNCSRCSSFSIKSRTETVQNALSAKNNYGAKKN